MHIFHCCENIKTCIFTAVKIQGLVFSREKTHKIGTTFFLYSHYGLREATLYGISVSKGNNYCVSYFYRNVNKKSESLRSLIKERAFINVCYN